MSSGEVTVQIDQAVIDADVTNEVLRQACTAAVENHRAGLAVNGCNVKFASILTEGTEVKVVAMVGGYPLGRLPIRVKTFEAAEAVRNGADELDVVVNIGAFKECSPDYPLREVRDAVRVAEGRPVKAVLETALLSDEQKVRLALICVDAGADYIGIATGFGPSAATVADVALLRGQLPPGVLIKATGRFQAWSEVKDLVDAGAGRIGLIGSLPPAGVPIS